MPLSDYAPFTPLTDRTPFPLWYLPSFILVGTLTTLAPLKFYTLRTILGTLALGTLVYNTPRYTTGGVAPDFVVGLFVSGFTLKFWEFVVYRKAEEYAWRVGTLNPFVIAREKEKEIGNGDVVGKENGTAAAAAAGTHNTAGINGAVGLSTSTTTNGNVPAHAAGNGNAKTNGEAKHFDEPRARAVQIHGKFDSTWEKLRWSAGLWTTTRGVEWNWGIKDLLPTAEENLGRLNFCRYTLHRLLYNLIALDFTRAIILQTPFGSPTTLHTVSVFTQPLFSKMVLSWLSGIQIYNALQVLYHASALLSTAVGLCRPEEWPPIYGSFRRDCWSVRNLWGKCWHQQIRRSITSPSVFIISTVLKLKRGTYASKYANLWISFFFSSMCHVFAQYLCSRAEGWNVLNWMSQAAAITVEDFVIEWGRKRGVRDGPYIRLLGALWVIIWLSSPLSLPIGANTTLGYGGAYDPPGPLELSAFFPFSLPKGGYSDQAVLLKALIHYGISWYCVQRGLGLVNARNGEEVASSALGVVGAVGLWAAGRS